MKEILLRTVTLGIIYLVRTQNFPKSNISNPLIRTRTYAYQRVRNVSFSENFSYILNEWSPLGVLRIFRKKNSGQKPATLQKAPSSRVFLEKICESFQRITFLKHVNHCFWLTHFMPLVSFYTPWTHQKTWCFLFSVGRVRN